jgi:uncharacterized protein (DUF934 family)
VSVENLEEAANEIEELRSYLEEEREKNEKQVRMTMDAHAEIERLTAKVEELELVLIHLEQEAVWGSFIEEDDDDE